MKIGRNANGTTKTFKVKTHRAFQMKMNEKVSRLLDAYKSNWLRLTLINSVQLSTLSVVERVLLSRANFINVKQLDFAADKWMI